jgi:hypothetical protein
MWRELEVARLREKRKDRLDSGFSSALSRGFTFYAKWEVFRAVFENLAVSLSMCALNSAYI